MAHNNRFDDLGEVVVVDVETTGLDKYADRILSVAALQVDMAAVQPGNDVAAHYFTADLNPGVPIAQGATAVHGIRDEDVEGRESFADIADDLREFIGDRPLVGHNVGFDKRFLQNEFKRTSGASVWSNSAYCTQKRLGYYLWRIQGGPSKPSLDYALKLLGIEGRQWSHHGAYEDAMLTFQLAAKLRQLDQQPGEATERWESVVGEVSLSTSVPSSEGRARTRSSPLSLPSYDGDTESSLQSKVVRIAVFVLIVVGMIWLAHALQ